mmetsp:Transcript_2428/g.2923  ORF Transcript_2428/g.2923 Transcript_2428/m.2923 type:complete len:142 (-) Transcript_2428:184-609(-)|eukprot:CAMPEP_0195251792 /NCGR_PEP_ID=MMETSP0706-20130129/3493_1 /TAXON_ID=33640 /ORGANISM="Asterionellopsis glacialis, Strain CCMP134" /LENGTH=141 /DNA_ID=CAMNT_0040303995 /DNA_START=121 /DNA_END=546 /DNA_ORIENTATION=-
MSTGVTVADNVPGAFNDFKLQRGDYKIRYFIYKIQKDEIVIEKMGAREKTYDDFVDDLPENDCRYGLIDVEFTTADERNTSKIVFVSWAPETAKVRSKMVYAGSKEYLKGSFNGVSINVNATDMSELDFETCILPAVQKFV